MHNRVRIMFAPNPQNKCQKAGALRSKHEVDRLLDRSASFKTVDPLWRLIGPSSGDTVSTPFFFFFLKEFSDLFIKVFFHMS